MGVGLKGKKRLVIDWRQLLSSLGPSNGAQQRNSHIVLTYQHEDFLTEAVSTFIAEGIQRKEGIVLIVTPHHWQLLGQRLRRDGIRLQEAMKSRRLNIINADELVAKLIVGGMPAEEKFKEVVGAMIGRIRRQYPVIRAYGEMVDILWHQGRPQAAFQLETLWNDLMRQSPFSLLCAYALNPLDASLYDGSLQALCFAHSHFIPLLDQKFFEETVGRVRDEVLGDSLSSMVWTLSVLEPPSTQMPRAQASLMWLAKNMPVTAVKILMKAHHVELSSRASPAR
jgi:hypothetical protein